MANVIIVLCGLIIGLAVYLFVRSLRKLAKGRCCEGCSGCPHLESCESALRDEPDASGDALSESSNKDGKVG